MKLTTAFLLLTVVSARSNLRGKRHVEDSAPAKHHANLKGTTTVESSRRHLVTGPLTGPSGYGAEHTPVDFTGGADDRDDSGTGLADPGQYGPGTIPTGTSGGPGNTHPAGSGPLLSVPGSAPAGPTDDREDVDDATDAVDDATDTADDATDAADDATDTADDATDTDAADDATDTDAADDATDTADDATDTADDATADATDTADATGTDTTGLGTTPVNPDDYDNGKIPTGSTGGPGITHTYGQSLFPPQPTVTFPPAATTVTVDREDEDDDGCGSGTGTATAADYAPGQPAPTGFSGGPPCVSSNP